MKKTFHGLILNFSLDKNYVYFGIVLGFLLILTVSLIQGFENALLNAFSHLINDLTKDLLVHLYILGIALIIFGLYSSKRKSLNRK